MSGDITDMKMAAAVMAGGRSSRMEGRHKGMLLTREGVTFTDRISAELHKFTDLVYISYGDTIQMEAAECRIVRDIYIGCGPVGGLHAVLTRAFLDGAAAVATAACDMPYVTAEFFGYLYEQLVIRMDISGERKSPFDLYDGVVAVTGGKIHPLAAIYSVRAAGICKTQLEERNLRVRDALAKLRILYVDLEGSAYERMILNINTEEDYTEYLISDAALS
ncbi:MAG: molybdenum cofactor guanylyltransferase [Lachnospiraceae bacterium]|nr:molybdenum cofactor guanylyltransferase [Lachnospiraceae bacterium]